VLKTATYKVIEKNKLMCFMSSNQTDSQNSVTDAVSSKCAIK